eukprot:CAMPEP_0184655256 /NCGR_PEP_ID=MMETSP0308-20130426/12880_1 /TAXON_ID=38269 /ORGANISM="Gloeochaete witrockiana, Strain SAG 46.84" /LENGTH=609 /DNA_ID=CAMNT_0027091629 /DNA_START=489 /DNA_END=2318 /DNA_ORIENTATION=+
MISSGDSDWSATVIRSLAGLAVASFILVIIARRRKSWRKATFYVVLFLSFLQILGTSLRGALKGGDPFAIPANLLLILVCLVSIRVTPNMLLLIAIPVPVIHVGLFLFTPLLRSSSYGSNSLITSLGAVPVMWLISYEQEKANRLLFYQSLELERSLNQSKEENTLLRRENATLRTLQQPQASRLNINTPLDDVVLKLKEWKSQLGEHWDSRIDSIIQTLQLTPNINRPVLHSNTVLNEADTTVSHWLIRECNVGVGSASASNNEKACAGSIRRGTLDVLSMENEDVPGTCFGVKDKGLHEELKQLCEWDAFDLWKVADLCKGSPLQAVSMQLFHHLGLVSAFQIERGLLAAFLKAVEGEYNQVPYHSSKHAADVVQAVGCFLAHPSFRNLLSDLEALALLFAAIVHDMGHQGSSNSFEVTSLSSRALLYNDRSVWENYHLHAAFAIVGQKQNDFLRCLIPSDWRKFRKMVINCVMATDMAHHFDALGSFKGRAASDGFACSEGREDLMKMALHLADISNPARPNTVYRHWVSAVMEEFYQQGDRERAAGLPISPFMDRTKPQVRECQCGFLDFIVIPSYSAWVEAFPDFANSLVNAQTNRRLWDESVR